jgi:hypothetical protein
LEKAKAVVDKHGPPRFFIALLCGLDDIIKKTFDDKELRRNMKAANQSSFNAMRSKFKKFIDEDPMQRGFKNRMQEYVEVSYFLLFHYYFFPFR